MSSTDEYDAHPLIATAPTDVLLWLFVGLSFGVAVTQILSARKNSILSRVPYTVVMFCLGLSCAAYLRYERANSGGRFDVSVLDWVHIDADLMLFIFLPPLVFGEAMQQNVFHLKKAAGQSFLLAGPGVLIGCVLMAALTKLILPHSYHWSWALCLLFGSILSATDTVSVLSLLHSAATSPKLTVVIVGESLANDGSAMILFTLFLQILQGSADLSPSGLSLFFLKTLLGSPLLGAAFGLVTVIWLRSAKRPLVHEDTTAQIAMTLCSAYLTFYTAQYVCAISGVLSVCSAGLVLAWLAPPIILKPATMDIVWDFITWIANTVIFLLSGLIIGHRVLREVENVDWLYLFILYVTLNIVRAVTVAVCYPWLSRWGHGLSLKEALFVTWAGLRGSLSMALALIVADEGSTMPGVATKETQRLFFFVGGIASLTLLINGGLARAVLDLLDLVNESSVENTLLFDRLQRRIASKLDKTVDSLVSEMNLTDQEARDVRAAISLLRHKDAEPIGGLIGVADAVAVDWRPSISGLSLFSAMRPSEVLASERDSEIGRARVATYSLSIDRRARPPGLLRELPLAEESNSADGSYASLQSLDEPADAEGAGGGEGPGPVRGARSLDGASSETFSYAWARQPAGTRAVSSASTGFKLSPSRAVFSSTFNAAAAAGHSPAGPHRARLMSRAQRVSSVVHLLRQDSIRTRGTNSPLMPELLAFVRTLFLEIVRTKYWELIDTSKLPRTSYAVRFLLYSVDVGLDAVNEALNSKTGGRVRVGGEAVAGSTAGAAAAAEAAEAGEAHSSSTSISAAPLWDFNPIATEINSEPAYVTALKALEALGLSDRLGLSCVDNTIARYEGRRNKRNVYILGAFVEAHTEAAEKLQSYLGGSSMDDEGEGDDGVGRAGQPRAQARREAQHSSESSGTTAAALPEALQVKRESAAAVALAQELLDAIPSRTVLAIRTKQCTLSALAKETQMVSRLFHEGMLTRTHAEILWGEITADKESVEQERAREQWKGGARTGRRGRGAEAYPDHDHNKPLLGGPVQGVNK